jgi:glycosyltransferase involved in cell wall biosynthesis
MTHPRVAVLIPTHNEENNIGKTLKSIVNQSLKPVIIIIHDTSDDETVEVSESILRESGVKYIIYRGKHYGFLSKWNISIAYYVLYLLLKKYYERMPIDYVATFEADTIYEEEYIEKLVKTLESDKRLCFVSGVLKPNIYIDPFPLSGLGIEFPWGGGRVYRYSCWEFINENYGTIYMPTWDTEHFILAWLNGYRTAIVKNASSYTLRRPRLFDPYSKGLADSFHGLPIYWALYKMISYRKLSYIIGFIRGEMLRRRTCRNNVITFLETIKDTYRWGLKELIARKLGA